MSEKNAHNLDTPAGYNGGKGPGDAVKLPTKHYPSSGNLGKGGGKGVTIDGPCENKEGYHK